MSVQKVNTYEQDVRDMADDYVALVNELIAEMAPFGPWWSEHLDPDEQLWRWLEVRPKIMPWLTEAGVWMGFQSMGELLDRMSEIWTTNTLLDMAPPDFCATVPIELLEMVQANPNDAAVHIKKMEVMFERRNQVQAQVNAISPPEARAPSKPLPSVLPEPFEQLAPRQSSVAVPRVRG